jgi:RHS repeat-associated protein
MKDPLGNLSRVTYDALNRVTQTTGPLGNTLQYTYDPNGNLLTFQDPRGSVTTYTYDSRDRVSSMTDPLNHVETYVYDAAGNRTRSTDRNGQVTGISYDSLNRATSVGFGASASSPTAYTSTIGYTWDAGNRLKQLVDSVSGTINLGFDDLDRLVTETSPQGQVAYTYYTNGLRQTMTVQGYNPVTYTYDDDGRLTQLVQGRATVGFTYDTADRRTSLTLPNGVQVGYTYDNAGQLTALTYQNGSTSIGNLTYGYDAAGRRTSVGGTLAQVTLPTAVSTASYDAANRLTSWGGSPLSYDNNGNLTAFGSSTYSWDARNQLVATSDGTGSFAYDAFGRRTTRTVAGATATYLHDGINPAVANGDFLLQSLGLDEIYARINAAGATSYLHDGLGSTSALTDGSGAVTASFAYEPYGATKRTGTDDTSFRFTGREDDGATKLYYYRARYYSPQLGRFISQDPIGLAGGANGYEYAGGNPVSFSDPLGLFITSVDAACAQNPDFCLEIMGQMVKNAAAASGNPCLEEQADQTADALNTVGNVLAVASVLHGAIPEGAAGKKLGYVRDFPTKETKNWSAMMNSEGEARALAREKLGTDPVEVEPGKWRSKDGKWQYRAKPGDVSDNHIHLEELDPETGEVLQNVHLRWPAGTGR